MGLGRGLLFCSVINVANEEWNLEHWRRRERARKGHFVFVPGGDALQERHFILVIPNIHEAVHIGWKSFESWHSNARMYC